MASILTRMFFLIYYLSSLIAMVLIKQPSKRGIIQIPIRFSFKAVCLCDLTFATMERRKNHELDHRAEYIMKGTNKKT